MTQSKRIAVCILRHLKEELGSSVAVSDESRESLEVAIQCIESVYEVSADDMNNLAVKATLPEMFTASTGNERMCFKPAQKSAPRAPKETNPEAEVAKQKGNELLKAEKYLEALEMYSKAIDLDPQNAVYFCNRAAAFSKLDKSQEAIADCEAALNIDPTYSKAYGRMGIAHAATGDHQKALECYQKAIELDPSNESYQNNIRVAREQLQAPNAPVNTPGGGQPGLGGGIGGLPDFTQMLGNPALLNMATQLMQDPGMQNLMTNIVSGTLGAGQQQQQAAQNPQTQATQQQQPAGEPATGFSLDNLLRAGQQFAQVMQNSNAPLVEQLRREMENRGISSPENNNQGGGGGGGGGNN